MTELPVAAAVIVQRHRVLLVRRAVTERGLTWQFPAGKVDHGESAEAAAVREAAEETGLAVVATSFLGERVHPSTGRRMLYVACEVVDGEAHVVEAREVAAVAWVLAKDLPGYVPYGFYGPAQAYLDARLVSADA